MALGLVARLPFADRKAKVIIFSMYDSVLRMIAVVLRAERILCVFPDGDAAAKAAAIDACEAGAKMLVCLTEHIPSHDVMEMHVAAAAALSTSRLQMRKQLSLSCIIVRQLQTGRLVATDARACKSRFATR